MWLRMRSLGLGVSEVSRAGALLRDILYRETWGKRPIGWGRGGAKSGSMSLATRSLSATDPNKGPGHAGGPQHLKSTWAAKPCLARTLGTGSLSDIHALLWVPLTMKKKCSSEKSKAVNPLKKKKKKKRGRSWYELLHNRLLCVWKCSRRNSCAKHLSIQVRRGSLRLPLALRNWVGFWNTVT